ncbi:MAG: cysteine--tRNA ligase [Candidatus Saccharibacteria bacterium]|nr:cysteine--tRNA ligase [Candidatus Saccharibacteria bacterium]
MTLRFHNTLTGNIDEFVPQTPGKALIYTCGPTVYDYATIGNLASYIYWDTLVRILMANDFEVVRVMNITDVGHLTSDADEGEDKLEKGAKRDGKTAWEIASFYTAAFIDAMNQLNLIKPQYLAKATDYIQDQLNLVRKLKDKGFTYQISDGIYFDTSKFPSYADFAHLDLDAQKAGARVEFNPEKRNHSDFALWKFTPTGTKRDMEWETPADLIEESDEKVMGFPGWHLECSAISMSILGETLDIHTGGIDHIPVHHSNEIAQSEAVTGKRFSNFWLHNEFLKVNGTKISKSLGNFFTLADLENKGFTPIDFRMFVLQGNYRNEGNFTLEGLAAAKNRLHNWRNVAALRHQTHDTIQADEEKNQNEKTVSLYASSQAIIEAISNDLGTPEALRIIDDSFTKILKARLKNINHQTLIKFLSTIDYTLGLRLVDSTPDINDDLKQLIIERNSARIAKNWDKADELRKKLLERGIVLRDNENESIWEYKD